MIFKSSERAKEGTKSQVVGIIKFLDKQLLSYETEAVKVNAYGTMGKEAMKIIEKNILMTMRAKEYYEKKLADYKKQGLV